MDMPPVSTEQRIVMIRHTLRREHLTPDERRALETELLKLVRQSAASRKEMSHVNAG